ncbi:MULTISPECIES: urea ABC transporter ATP-binding protein UrtD [unclassified Mameliella]|uniref:urea ABC transporter ATP-binding protein UrtD n=1 Tax=Mameliella sp. LZ-28 TaxID=2484146 RepID=UPI00143F8D01|nr:urea ABC transporter ATP-binding protein UrtD [Mameliella sp. LZ-28]
MALLDISDLHVEFGGLRAVDGFDLSVDRGEILCLLGPNGAGKSTTLDLICGKTQPTGGSIRFEGKEISNMLEFHRARHGIGRKFQVPSVFKELTVDENLQVARSNRYGLMQTLSSFVRSKSAEIERILDLVELGAKRDQLAGNLSHGETQWLEIAMLIAQDSKLILMDEPTAGMTIQETDKTAEIFKTLRQAHALIVVEHDMSFVRQVADRITVMAQGKKLAEGSIAEIETNEAVKSAYLGH